MAHQIDGVEIPYEERIKCHNAFFDEYDPGPVAKLWPHANYLDYGLSDPRSGLHLNNRDMYMYSTPDGEKVHVVLRLRGPWNPNNAHIGVDIVPGFGVVSRTHLFRHAINFERVLSVIRKSDEIKYNSRDLRERMPQSWQNRMQQNSLDAEAALRHIISNIPPYILQPEPVVRFRNGSETELKEMIRDCIVGFLHNIVHIPIIHTHVPEYDIPPKIFITSTEAYHPGRELENERTTRERVEKFELREKLDLMAQYFYPTKTTLELSRNEKGEIRVLVQPGVILNYDLLAEDINLTGPGLKPREVFNARRRFNEAVARYKVRLESGS